MGVASLGSGSRGNGTLVAIGGAVFLVDCGFTLKQTEQRLARLQLSLGDLSAILSRHEHSDHIAGVTALSHRYGIQFSPPTARSKTSEGSVVLRLMVMPFEVEGVVVNPVVVPHDAREPTQFTLQHDDMKIGVLSEGSVRARCDAVCS